MKNKNLSLLLIFLILSIINLNAQEKYAVLITGNYVDLTNPGQWHGDEYWNDTFLMWEMLQEKGYSTDNIFVLFADGIDYSINNDVVDRYEPPQFITVTDKAATIAAITDVFDGLATGDDDYPLITEDDFLFVWTFLHGIIDVCPPYGGYFPMTDGNMTDDFLAEKINQVSYNRRAFWMQGDRSFMLVDELGLSGLNTVFVSAGSGNDICHPADDIPVTENEKYLVNNQLVPYHHGEFDFHMYSSTNGSDPDGNTSYDGFPFSDADLNSDNYISVKEASLWEIDKKSITEEDTWYDDDDYIGYTTAIEWPTLIHSDINSDPIYRGLIGIAKDIEVLWPHTLVFTANSDIHFLDEDINLNVKYNTNMEFDGNINLFSDNNNQVIVKNNGTLIIKNGSNVNFFNDQGLLVEQGGTLIIEDNVTIGGNSNTQLIIDGNIQVGQGVTFQNIGHTGYPEGLVFNNTYPSVSFEEVTLINTGFVSYRSSFDISNSSFEDCFVAYFFNGNNSIGNSSIFTNTWLYFDDQSTTGNHTVSIIGCTCINNEGTMMAGIDIWNYDNYMIFSNTIQGFYNGIQVSNSGEGEKGSQLIYGNTITDNSLSGIILYYSTAEIENNSIQNNNYGVRLYNHSNVELTGDLGSNSNGQLIQDNESYEVYASKYSFPAVFEYNQIIDEDNIGNPFDPLVYHNGGTSLKDVRYNYWGNNFDPSEDFYPSGYMYQPIWYPNNSNSDKEVGSAELLYSSAMDHFEQESYLDAQTTFKQLILEYPQSRFAQEAMKKLLTLEKFINNDYEDLKLYYTTNVSIASDTSLQKIGGFLANKCELKMENWPSAIEHYENIILNPESFEDSIFAMVDLGYAYILMETGGYKSAYTGTLIEHKPESKQQYIEKKDYLLSLLPGEKMSQNMKDGIKQLNSGELLQNVPNPFRGSTKIWYKLENESFVQLSIYNYTGQMIKTYNEGAKTKGTHYIDFDANGLKNGIYFYSININGQTTDSKKMTVMK